MQSVENNTILDNTESVCPICLKVIPAKIIVNDKEVYQQKKCQEHGKFITYIWPDVYHYQWMKDFQFPLKKPQQTIKSHGNCPWDCGLCTTHSRKSTLVEIELTQRCNLRCPVCFMAADEVQAAAIPGPDLKEIEGIYKGIMAKTGTQTSIQLTGGEPTVRKDLPDIVRLGRHIGFNAIEVNTNGMVIAQNPGYVKELKDAGISGIYLQFDGLNGTVYEKIRGKDLLDHKLVAIQNCQAAGVQVVLAMTVIGGINHDQMGKVLDFALQRRDVIAGIAYQPAFGSGRFDVSVSKRLTLGDVAFSLAEQSHGLIDPYDFWPLGCSHPLCDAATYIIEAQGTLKPLTRLITKREYMNYYDSDSPQGSVFPDIADKMFPEVNPGLSIVIMGFMDAMNMDLKRLRQCSMTVTGPEGRIVPFCVYQLTSMDGKKMSEIISAQGK